MLGTSVGGFVPLSEILQSFVSEMTCVARQTRTPVQVVFNHGSVSDLTQDSQAGAP